MEEANETQADAPEEENQESNGSGRQAKTWYPYITKVQFEKFLARLESKVPEQIDRDYVRAIIRTPSMIYRFLRGIEAMKLIDRDQRPTPLLGRVINSQTRAFALAEVQRDLYKDLLEEQEKSGDMNDEEIVEYFRERTGMGRDSANKMKMFFKYLNGESDFSEPPAHVQAEVAAQAEAQVEAPAAEATEEVVESKEEKEETTEVAAKAEPVARPSGRERGERNQERNDRNERSGSERSSSERSSSERSSSERSSSERSNSERSSSERNDRNQDRGRDNRPQRSQEQPAAPAAQSSSYQDRPPRPLTEQQKAYLDAVRSVVSINIDGDWDEDMIRVAFDRLERLLDRIRRI